MSDFLAGQTLTPLHFTPTVSNEQAGSFTYDATTYGVDADGGTYVTCGVAFIAPATGRVKIHHAALASNSTTGSTDVAPAVRTGSTVGSGTVFVAASNNNRVTKVGTGAIRAGVTSLITGLTPGSAYNVRLEHKVSTGVGTVAERTVVVEPAT